MKTTWKAIFIISLLLNLTIIYIGYKALEYRTHINEYLDKYTYVVDDFSKRNNFKDDNQQYVSKHIMPGRIVFFGTQLVEQWPLEKYFVDYEYINRGIFGQRLSGMVLRLYPDVIDLHPEYAIIEISSYNFRPENDLTEIEDYLKMMLALSTSEGIKPIACTIIPPCRDSIDFSEYEYYDNGDYDIADSIILFNQHLYNLCLENDYLLLDSHRYLTENGYLKTDYASGPIDLNKAGYAVLSDAIKKLILATHQ